jgi:hypothetical protein
VPSKVILARLQALGEFITSASIPVPSELVRQLRAEFRTQPTAEIRRNSSAPRASAAPTAGRPPASHRPRSRP